MPTPEIKFTDEQKRLYRAALAPQATAEQWDYFITECERRALIPGVHVVFQLRTAEEFNPALQRKVTVQKVTLITTINALRLIAERSGKFEGYGRFTYFYSDDEGNPTVKSEIPLGKVPHVVGVELYRAGWRNPVFSTARYDACVSLKSDKTPTAMWYKRGEEQLAKCAEANGLRMVAPEECGGLYIEEEMPQHNNAAADAESVKGGANFVAKLAPEVPISIPTPTVAPAVNQAPAPVAPENTASTPVRPVDAPVAPPKAPESGSKPVTSGHPVSAPKPPARPTPPKVAAPPVSKAVSPVAPAETPAPADLNHREPAKEEEPKESPAELVEVANRIARDKDPVKPTANIHGVNITDEDLPENLRAPQVPPVNSPTPVVIAAETAKTADTPVTAAEYTEMTGKAAKIVRDKLEKQARIKNAGALVKDYLLKKSGKARLQQISYAVFSQLISQLETATPEDAAALVKESK